MVHTMSKPIIRFPGNLTNSNTSDYIFRTRIGYVAKVAHPLRNEMKGMQDVEWKFNATRNTSTRASEEAVVEARPVRGSDDLPVSRVVVRVGTLRSVAFNQDYCSVMPGTALPAQA